jgi:bifunctional UDP-N-acetylglucosamine pyrophosphorylase/glucosamine-1-phosphate N-acetyltransferase
VTAALSAGAKVVGITGTSSADTLLAAGADRAISDLVELSDLLDLSAPSRVDPSQWSAVIPAAGRGSRLGFHLPKILYPVAGRPILDWLLDLVAPHCARLIFVVSPDGAATVAPELARRLPGRFEVVVQETPTGMGDAVSLALPKVATPHVAVMWGDQVALRPGSVESCLRLHQGPLEPDITCPTVIRTNPYIHVVRDATGRIVSLLQAREGDAMPSTGESDAGFFCFRTARLRRLLEHLRADTAGIGSSTGEFNLLPVVPLAARDGLVLTPRLLCLEETVGINAVQDVARVEAFLRRSDGGRA